MHRTTHTLSLLLATGFVGCVTPEPMTLPQPKVAALTVTAAPTSTPSQATVLPSNAWAASLAPASTPIPAPSLPTGMG